MEEVEKSNERQVDQDILLTHAQKYIQVLIDKIHLYLQNYLLIDKEIRQIQENRRENKAPPSFDSTLYQQNLETIITSKKEAKLQQFN